MRPGRIYVYGVNGVISIVMVFSCVGSASWATIYQCRDAINAVVLTNRPGGLTHCQVLSEEKDPPLPASADLRLAEGLGLVEGTR